MKKLILPFSIIVALYLISGCSTKFNVAAPYKNITVVYGLLDMADTAHYIRIEKAFLDQNKSALTMAQVADSSFYNNLNVRIERYNFADIGAWHDTIHLNRVDLNNEGYQKQQGVFFYTPNYAYKFTNALDTTFIYRIVVTNLTTHESDSAEAPIINDLNTSVFSVDILDDTATKMDFSSTASYRTFEFQVSYNNNVNNFNFEGSASPIGVIQTVIRFNWIDSNNLTHDLTNQYYDYNLGDIITTGGQDYKIKDQDLYNAITSGLGQAPPNIYRLLGRCTFYIYLSTTDFYNYQQASLTQGTGLTGGEIEPVATNVKGANALGLYTSRAMRSGPVTISGGTIDSLMLNPMLSQARIAGTSYH